MSHIFVKANRKIANVYIGVIEFELVFREFTEFLSIQSLY